MLDGRKQSAGGGERSRWVDMAPDVPERGQTTGVDADERARSSFSSCTGSDSFKDLTGNQRFWIQTCHA
jgi:hypothetical protein